MSNADDARFEQNLADWRAQEMGLLDPGQPTKSAHMRYREIAAKCPVLRLALHECEACAGETSE